MSIKFIKPNQRQGLRVKSKVRDNDITDDLLYCGSGWEYEDSEDDK